MRTISRASSRTIKSTYRRRTRCSSDNSLCNTGKLCFATLQSGAGTRLQVMLSLAVVGEELLGRWKALVDLG
ncbi:MAG: hypothetical protein WA880_02660, partial [Ornithinimicrobium sp.]